MIKDMSIIGSFADELLLMAFTDAVAAIHN